MGKFQEYLEAAKGEKPLKQSALNSMMVRVKEDIEDIVSNGDRKLPNSQIKQMLTELLGENYEYSRTAASKEQIAKAVEILVAYRDKCIAKKKKED